MRAQGSVVTGHIQGLAAEARSLEAAAPDETERAKLTRLRTGLDGLVQALETDRTLRLTSPPPNEDQLGYSALVISQHVEEVDAILHTPAAPPT